MRQRSEISLRFGNDVYTIATKDSIPFNKGIYLAYPGKFDKEKEFVVLNDTPIYIGKGHQTPIKQRIYDHSEKDYAKWRKFCNQDQDIYYRVAELKTDIEDVEAAMIFTHKPKGNSDGVDNYMGSRPAPDVDYDIALPLVNGAWIDTLDLNSKLNS